MQFIEIGPVPGEENCAQVGSPDYTEASLRECEVFRRMLYRLFPVPEGLPVAYIGRTFLQERAAGTLTPETLLVVVRRRLGDQLHLVEPSPRRVAGSRVGAVHDSDGPGADPGGRGYLGRSERDGGPG